MSIENYYSIMTRLQPTQSVNDKLEEVRNYSSNTSNINAHIGSRNDFEITSHGKVTIKTQYRFYSDTKCNDRDIIKFNNEFYRLISDMSYAGKRIHHYRGFIEKIDGIDS